MARLRFFGLRDPTNDALSSRPGPRLEFQARLVYSYCVLLVFVGYGFFCICFYYVVWPFSLFLHYLFSFVLRSVPRASFMFFTGF